MNLDMSGPVAHIWSIRVHPNSVRAVEEVTNSTLLGMGMASENPGCHIAIFIVAKAIGLTNATLTPRRIQKTNGGPKRAANRIFATTHSAGNRSAKISAEGQTADADTKRTARRTHSSPVHSRVDRRIRLIKLLPFIRCKYDH